MSCRNQQPIELTDLISFMEIEFILNASQKVSKSVAKDVMSHIAVQAAEIIEYTFMKNGGDYTATVKAADDFLSFALAQLEMHGQQYNPIVIIPLVTELRESITSGRMTIEGYKLAMLIVHGVEV